MKKSKSYTIIDTAGQKTAVVNNGFVRREQPFIAKLMMTVNPMIEQVAFLENGGEIYRCQMMGNELSINGSLATAYLLAKQQQTLATKLEISGMDKSVIATKTNGTISIDFPKKLVQKIYGNTVYLQGIAYQLIKGFPDTYLTTSQLKAKLQKLATHVPAAGIIFYKDNQVVPLVYVKSTNSYVWENACGSGSLAFFLVTRINLVTQPSGEIIKISQNNDTLTISSPVKEVYD